MLAKFERLRRMDSAEFAWRATTVARATVDRVRTSVRPSRWRRSSLRRELADTTELAPVHVALIAGRWSEAHRLLARHFVDAPQRFLIAPTLRNSLASTIGTEFPGAAADAEARANRILRGEYDLLGYRRLRWDGPPNWHADPVNHREAPRSFWTTVPFLDAACGDHKIIWELNRHQHWIPLGRAYWLTGDSRYRDTFIAQLHSWLAANPPLVGINWASMLELAFRSISWIWGLEFFVERPVGDEPPWVVDLLMGLAAQLRHVEQNLSYYFSPNTHLLGEALALYVAGRTLPELVRSETWQSTGRAILIAEIDRQITADGGHAERSTHYHRYTLDFYLMALAVARITGEAPQVIAAFERAAARLAFVCRLLADERGRLPQFGDDDGGMLTPLCGRAPDDVRDTLAVASALVERPDLRIGHAPEEAFWTLAHPALLARLDRAASAAPPDALGSAALPDTGYYVSRSPAGDHLVFDAGPHGYQNGGHAHADALSLTFSVGGTPLLIDPGTGSYTVDPVLRDRFRSSQLHNTVTIDERSQSVPHGPFHWAHVATASASRWRANGAFDYLDATHDGYAPLVHRRHVLTLPGDLLIVADLITEAEPRAIAATPESTDASNATSAEAEHTAAVHWHLDPRWTVEVKGRRARAITAGHRVDLVTPEGVIESFYADDASGLGWHAPVYGRITPTTTLRITRRSTVPFWMVSVFGLTPDVTIERVEYVPVWSEAGALTASLAIRIVRRASVDYFVLAHPTEVARRALATWRVGELETDAHMLFCRCREDGGIARAALVDGSCFRAGGRRVQVLVPRLVPDLHVDLTGITSSEPFTATEARLSGPGFGARIIVSGRELPIAIERRASQRTARSMSQVNE